MSSKIEGVPRELLVRLNNLHATGNDIDIEMAEVRTLLDAPVVERQPVEVSQRLEGAIAAYFGRRELANFKLYLRREVNSGQSEAVRHDH
jgi:hypothetical protein